MVVDLARRDGRDKELNMIEPGLNIDHLPLDLGDGLLLRCAGAEDAQALSDFNARVHSDEGLDKPDERVWAWTYDLLARPHPTFKPEDFTIVEETVTHKIVSSLNLIPQTWTYAGIPFKVGRPELVGTLPEFRNRGLVRLQFDVIHRWSDKRGHKLQAITGIPYYYRQFGYEMALNLGGGRVGYAAQVPQLKDGEPEPFRIRLATEADIPVLSRLLAINNRRCLVACEWDEALWRYEISGKDDKNVNRQVIRLVETLAGQPCGFFTHQPFTWGDAMVLLLYEILPEFSWQEVTPSVIRSLASLYTEYQPMHGEKKPLGAFGFWLGEEHPAYHVVSGLLPRIRKPYAWYLRLPDLPGFLRLVKPVLENRLANSPMAGYTGELKITFYRDGLQLTVDKGQLITIEAWKPTPLGHSGNVAFPPLTFLQLLFGYRTMDMLKASFPDCWTDNDEIHALLDALFPRQPSDFWPVS